MLATVEEVLQTMTDDDIVYDDNYPAQFLIDNDLRIITVPSDGVVLGVENDKDVNLVKFRMPRFYKKQDLSSFNIKVIFENANKELGYYIVPNKEINEDSLEFGWLLDHTVTAYKGAVRFIVYLSTLQQDSTADANTYGAGTVTSYVDQAFNTTIGTANVLEGLSIDQEYAPGQVEDILSKLQQYADQIINKASAELTTKVNSAVEKASTATDAANTAAANANAEAAKANTATTNANEAITNANNATSAANEATTNADAATAKAKEATTNANNASDAANTATAKVNEAIENANNATNAANTATANANTATSNANKAVDYIASNLYPVADNILKGTVKDTFVHVDDAFPSKLLAIEIEGATEQNTTTGKNLLDFYKLAKNSIVYYTVENRNLKVLVNDDRDWHQVPVLMTLKAGTYCVSGQSVEIRSASDLSDILNGNNKFTLDRDTEVKVKVGTELPNYPVVIKAQIEIGDTATSYEPYTGGKPSPSPDFPQDIKVIENPVVKITGRNLLDNKYPTYGASYNNGIALVNKYNYNHPNITLPFTSGPRSSDGFGFIIKLIPNVTYTLKTFNSPDKSIAAISGYSNIENTADVNSVIWNLSETSLKSPIQFSVKRGGEYVVVTFAAEWGNGTNQVTYPADFKAVIEYGVTATYYKPYSLYSQAFTLPVEHPYLAKVDNKADEIAVDKDGNIELIARVGVDKNVRELDNFQLGYYYSFNTNLAPFENQNKEYSGAVLCSALLSKYHVLNGEGIYRTWNDIYVKDTSGRTREEIQAEVDKNAPLTVVAEIPEMHYSLGKIEMPKLQDNIANVWTDAEVTPNTNIKYVRDVNIVVSNLETAIASITEG